MKFYPIFIKINHLSRRYYHIPTELERVKAHLTDGTGRVVFQQEGLSGVSTLNLRHLASGSYMLHLQSEDGKLQESHKIQITK